MFSYFNININVGAMKIQTAPPFPEKVAQFEERIIRFFMIERIAFVHKNETLTSLIRTPIHRWSALIGHSTKKCSTVVIK
jgi:hypothetical protein